MHKAVVSAGSVGLNATAVSERAVGADRAVIRFVTYWAWVLRRHMQPLDALLLGALRSILATLRIVWRCYLVRVRLRLLYRFECHLFINLPV